MNKDKKQEWMVTDLETGKVIKKWIVTPAKGGKKKAANKKKLASLAVILLVLIFYGVSASARTLVIQNPRLSPDASPIEIRESEPTIRTVTAYSALDSCHYPKGDGCLTASGKLASGGIVACPRTYPFGTKVEILGKVYVCEDRLAKRYDDRIDIWMDSHADSIAFGIKQLEITILP